MASERDSDVTKAAQPTASGPAGRRPVRRMLGSVRSISPELIAGASDNDPTNVGTAAVVGARTAYRLSWVALAVGPLLAVVLAIAAQVGLAARDDLQTLALRTYGRGVAAVLLVSIVVVNLVTIAADLQAGAAGIGLLAGVDPRWLVLPFGLALAGLLVFGRYQQVAAVLRYLLIGFLAFVVAAGLARPDWRTLLEDSFIPSMTMRPEEVAGAVAVLGTTLTSYVYLWETVQRGTEGRAGRDPGRRLARARVGAVAGGAFTALIMWSMLIASAATLGRHHDAVGSAAAAARAVRPLAGRLAGDMFAAGLAVSAIVALPVLVASTAYAVGAQFGWQRGLSRPIGQARRFYAVLAASIATSTVLTLAGVPVFGMLVAASIAGGIGTPIGLAVLLCLARNSEVMAGRPVSARLAAAGWAVTAVVTGLGGLFLVSQLQHLL